MNSPRRVARKMLAMIRKEHESLVEYENRRDRAWEALSDKSRIRVVPRTSLFGAPIPHIPDDDEGAVAEPTAPRAPATSCRRSLGKAPPCDVDHRPPCGAGS